MEISLPSLSRFCKKCESLDVSKRHEHPLPLTGIMSTFLSIDLSGLPQIWLSVGVLRVSANHHEDSGKVEVM
jgi:hypothetical protein